MNDADLDEPIVNATSQVQETYRQGSVEVHSEKRVRDSSKHVDNHSENSDSPELQSPAYAVSRPRIHDTAFTMPTRWWYASTGFPLLTGTFGPMANAFSICALVQNWRTEVPPGTPDDAGKDVPDPAWLLAVNAVSLLCAITANLSLLLNMAERIPFSIAQPITIVGFWLSSVLLIALLATMSGKVESEKYQIKTQAYYYGCWAAGLYQIISCLMCVTVYGAVKGKYKKEFNLTIAQRTLMLQTISFLTYLLLGALVYSKIEGWKFLDAVYWADFTLLTVGIGDLAPSTHLGRGLLFPFAIGGIVILGLVVSSIRSLVLERGKKKLSARMTEKTRRKVVKQADAMRNEQKLRRRRRPLGGIAQDTMKRLAAMPQDDPEDELERRRAEFEAMRQVQQSSSNRQKWMNLFVSTTAFALLWFVGAAMFYLTELTQQGWTHFASMYFSYTSLLTIGYGDLSPVSNSGKPFFVFWSLLAVPSLTILISDMGDTVVKGVKDLTIWVGEVSILPSSSGSVKERLRYGAIRATGGTIQNWQKRHNEEESSDDSGSSIHEEAPGHWLFNILGKNRKKQKPDINAERIARDFEAAEVNYEEEARSRGDVQAENEHHYRHILLAQIRKVYTDTTLASPKHYSFEEWAFFLKLLGEDESSSEFHRNAQSKHRSTAKNETHDQPEDESTEHDHHTQRPSSDQDQQKLQAWSWMGPRSPLMSDKNESEILLELLFERLEESLREINKHKEEPLLSSTTTRTHNGAEHESLAEADRR